MTDTPPDRWLSIDDLCAMWGLSRYAVISLMKQGKLPVHSVRDQCPRWKSSDIDAWITKLKARKEART